MDQKRLVLAIAISLAIMLGFQAFVAPYLPKPEPPPQQQALSNAPSTLSGNTQTGGPSMAQPGGTAPASQVNRVPKVVPRVAINARKLSGSISLLGARLDDIILTDYRETIEHGSPFVRLLEPRSDDKPYYVQYGWTAPTGDSVTLPGDDTVWTATGGPLTSGNKVTLSWQNGQGLTFLLDFAIDDDYLFTVRQSVRNSTGQPINVLPWSRIRREYKPETSGYYILHEGMLGVVEGSLKETTYDGAKSDGEKKKGIALDATTTAGWAGITDKYWLTTMIPDQAIPTHVYFRHIEDKAALHKDQYQVDYVTREPMTAGPGGETSLDSHLFVGAKVVRLLDRYEAQLNLPHFDKAVDFGYFYFLTKPIFYAIDYFYGVLGNFGLAIMLFTVIVKALFFPLADYSYRSMSKMKLLGPKMAELKERYKDEPQKLQPEMMALYRAEKVNPASGCLPIVIQIPVFFSLYKVIFVTIEMRQAPFYGWIKDLSQVDPTNIFNLFGLIPVDPTQLPGFGAYLHMGVWPLIMGITMFLQQKLNPPPPDPVQAKMFQFMPILFTFMMAGFPAGLIIYWSWNNLLSIGQQWLMMRRTRLEKPSLGADLVPSDSGAVAPGPAASCLTDEALEVGRKLFAAECRFFFGAQKLEQLPPPAGPEIAFAGRSNVGKSSLLNALTGRHSLARISSEPGRTRQLNFFDLGGRLTLVDMPGYGYARASKDIKADWQGMMFDYLRGRPTLIRVMLLLDSRIELKPSDLEVMKLLDRAAVTYQIVLTKVDGLKPPGLARKQGEIGTLIRKHPAAFPEIATTSAQTGLGIPELRAVLAGLPG